MRIARRLYVRVRLRVAGLPTKFSVSQSCIRRRLRSLKHTALPKRYDSSVGIATHYRLERPGIESRWGQGFSTPVKTGPRAHTASSGLFPSGKAAGACRWPPTPVQRRGQGRVQLYLYSPWGPSGHVIRVNRTFPSLYSLSLINHELYNYMTFPYSKGEYSGLKITCYQLQRETFEKLTPSRLLTTFPTLHGSWSLITLFTATWTLFEARRNHTTPSNPNYF